MNIDFSQRLNDVTGKPWVDGSMACPHCSGLFAITGGGVPVKWSDKTIVTLSTIAITALLKPDEAASDTDKANRCKIAFMIAQATEPVTLSLDDAALVKRLIGKHPLPLVVGQAYQMLENEKPAKSKKG